MDPGAHSKSARDYFWAMHEGRKEPIFLWREAPHLSRLNCAGRTGVGTSDTQVPEQFLGAAETLAFAFV